MVLLQGFIEKSVYVVYIVAKKAIYKKINYLLLNNNTHTVLHP